MELSSEVIASQEAVLVPDDWTASVAVGLGEFAAMRARAGDLPLAIVIRHLGRTVYQVALSGSAPIHDDWAMRKVRVVELFGKSSLLVRVEHEEAQTNFAVKHALPESLYKAAGGAVPIYSRSGLVGVIAVSGLVEATDHVFCVNTLGAYVAELRKGV